MAFVEVAAAFLRSAFGGCVLMVVVVVVGLVSSSSWALWPLVGK